MAGRLRPRRGPGAGRARRVRRGEVGAGAGPWRRGAASAAAARAREAASAEARAELAAARAADALGTAEAAHSAATVAATALAGDSRLTALLSLDVAPQTIPAQPSGSAVRAVGADSPQDSGPGDGGRAPGAGATSATTHADAPPGPAAGTPDHGEEPGPDAAHGGAGSAGTRPADAGRTRAAGHTARPGITSRVDADTPPGRGGAARHPGVEARRGGALSAAELDAFADSLRELLDDSVSAAERQLFELRTAAADDARILGALGDGGLLPAGPMCWRPWNTSASTASPPCPAGVTSPRPWTPWTTPR